MNAINQVGLFKTPECGRYDDPLLFDLLLAGSHNGFIIGLWGVSYTLYDTLPKFTKLARMNGLKSVFIRHPKRKLLTTNNGGSVIDPWYVVTVMYHLSLVHILVICTSNTLLVLILPTALGADARSTLDVIFLSTLIILAIEYQVVLVSVCNILSQLYYSVRIRLTMALSREKFTNTFVRAFKSSYIY